MGQVQVGPLTRLHFSGQFKKEPQVGNAQRISTFQASACFLLAHGLLAKASHTAKSMAEAQRLNITSRWELCAKPPSCYWHRGAQIPCFVSRHFFPALSSDQAWLHSFPSSPSPGVMTPTDGGTNDVEKIIQEASLLFS